MTKKNKPDTPHPKSSVISHQSSVISHQSSVISHQSSVPHPPSAVRRPPSAVQVGITGGIGSGKTTVCKIFETLGIPVYYADDRAKAIMVENPIVMEQIIDQIGPASYFPDGSLNRKYIAGIVFKNTEKLDALNKIVHPAVGQDGLDWHHAQANVPYTLREAALMIESGSYRSLSKLIVVAAPKEIRLQRVMKRDGTDREAVLARMDKQMSEEEKLKYADFVINNDGRHSLVKQVWGIHHQLISGKK